MNIKVLSVVVLALCLLGGEFLLSEAQQLQNLQRVVFVRRAPWARRRPFFFQNPLMDDAPIGGFMHQEFIAFWTKWEQVGGATANDVKVSKEAIVAMFKLTSASIAKLLKLDVGKLKDIATNAAKIKKAAGVSA
jgi:hypothetical protein